jgi:hypothetical protein
MRTLSVLSRDYRGRFDGGPTMGFSIGGWHPFGGGLVSILEGGTINGHTVFSGGLAGVAEHLDEVAQGVNVSLLGGSLGGALNDLVKALDAPVINLTKWVDAHKVACIAVVAIVGIAVLCPYGYAAWAAETSEAEVTATLDLVPEELALTSTETVGADVGALEASSTAGASLTADTGAALSGSSLGGGVATTTGADATAGLESLGASSTTGASLTAGGDVATLTPAEMAAAPGAAASGGTSALGAAVEKALLTTAVSGVTGELLHLAVGTPAPKTTTIPLVTAPASSVPSWVYLAGAAAVLILLVRR